MAKHPVEINQLVNLLKIHIAYLSGTLVTPFSSQLFIITECAKD